MSYMSPWTYPYMQNIPAITPVQQTQSYPHATSGPTKVNGPQSAIQIGYQMGPNRMSEAIFDMSGKVFYIVSTDGAGVPSVETFDFSPHVQPEPAVGGQYVQRSEFDEVIGQLKEAINGIHGSVQTDATTADTAT